MLNTLLKIIKTTPNKILDNGPAIEIKPVSLFG
jgi:hypothetical protein